MVLCDLPLGAQRALLGEKSAIPADGEIGITHAKQHQPDQWHEGEGEHIEPQDNEQYPCQEEGTASLFPDIEVSEAWHDRQRSGAAGMGGFFKRIHIGQGGSRLALRPQHYAFSAASTSSTWPGTFTFRNKALTRPVASITTVLRSIPQYFRPYMLFSL